MVATLVSLRWRLTLNALRSNVWALIGSIIGALYAIGALGGLIVAAVGLGAYAAPQDAAVLLGALGAALVIGWCLIPLLLTGADATLDPRAIAAWAAPSRPLARGLLAAGAAGIPGLVTAVACLLPVLVWIVAGQFLAALLALICAPAALAACVTISRIIVVSANLSSSRRGKEMTTIIAFVVVLIASLLPSLFNASLGAHGPEILESFRRAGQILALTPFGWAFLAPGMAATGKPLAALALAAGAWIIPLALLRPWERLVAAVMTRPAGQSGRTRAYAPASGDQQSAGSVDALTWARRLRSLLPGLPAASAAIAARCLRYWRSDPRYLAQVVSIVFLPMVLVIVPIGIRGTVQVNGEPLTMSLAIGQAPALMLLTVPFIGLLMGWAIHDDLGFDSTALWSHISAGVPGRHDILGRVVAAAVWELPSLLLIGAGMLLWTGRWQDAPALMGGALALYGCSLGWSAMTCILLPYETNAPGESPLNSRTSGMAIVVALIQMIGMLVILLASAPATGPAIYAVLSDSTPWRWAAGALGLLWGTGAAGLGIIMGGRLLDARGPAILATIRSWPGHSQER